MTLLGLSILVASISFLCFRHPPASWAFVEWLRRPAIQDGTRSRKTDAAASINNYEKEKDIKGAIKVTKDVHTQVTKAEEDRMAMPPPPSPLVKSEGKRPSPPTTPRASSFTQPAASLPPSFNLIESYDENEPVAPSFPAANSAQRASGGTHPTSSTIPITSNSTPLFPAANSAQRASNDSRGPPRLNPTPQVGLMAPPPPRAPIPNRGPPSNTLSSSSLALPPTHNAPPTKPRKKVLLTPGHSPLDWARLSASASLSGLPPGTGYIRVPPSLLKQYTGRKGKDAWTVLGGKVYNITPYLPYHPGGEPELMKCAGRDGTRLFGEVHPWVNWEGMLEGCLVGLAVEEGEINKLDEMD